MYKTTKRLLVRYMRIALHWNIESYIENVVERLKKEIDGFSGKNNTVVTMK